MKLARTLIFLLIVFPVVSLLPQDINKEETDKKIKNLKGDVQKITITTSDGTVEIEGEEAAYLLKKLKRKSIDKNIELYIKGVEKDSVYGNKKSVIIKKNGEKIKIKMKPDNFLNESGDSSLKKTVKILKDDSGLSVTIVTAEDGKEEVEILTGSDAEGYLKNLIENQNLLEFDIEIEKEGKNKKFMIKTEKKKTTE